jgi:NAD-dependent DNA ligase
MHSDRRPYARFTKRSRLEKSINSLLGIVEGIAADRLLNSSEINFLELWLGDHREVCKSHPYIELMPRIEAAISAGALTEEEKENIGWLCEQMKQSGYFDKATADLQRLQGILGGIVADGRITEAELLSLSAWLESHHELRTCWPYDEVDTLVTQVMRDGKIDESEHRLLKEFFADFVEILDDRTLTKGPVLLGGNIAALCASCPEITFEGSVFCFTGHSPRYKRRELAKLIVDLGGEFVDSMSKKIRYLIVGADGNPCWAFACYGRKIQRAVELRKQGSHLLIIHENDFHDAVADYRMERRSQING